jgi:hypothetical protein
LVAVRKKKYRRTKSYNNKEIHDAIEEQGMEGGRTAAG